MPPFRRGGSPRPGSTVRLPGLAVVVSVAVLAAALTGCTGGSTDPAPSAPGPASTPSAGSSSPSSEPSSSGPSSSGSLPAGELGPLSPDPAKDAALAVFYGQKVTWSGCVETLECTKVTVPVDWAAPSGATLQLAVIRHRATGTKLGSLLQNPGGPGVSGVDFFPQGVVGQYGRSLLSSFDLVSWDPRGTGASSPVRCLPNSQLDRFWSVDATPDTTAERTQFVDDFTTFAAACQANTGPLLAHVDTISTVRDMDVLRAVVGDDVLNFVGASNGTYLGAWYAQLFPWRVGRMVLDGALDPSLDAAANAQGQAQGFARAVRAYLEDCLTSKDCPLRGSLQDAYGQLGALLDRVDAQPLRTASGRPLTQGLFDTGLLFGMYSKQLWPAVTQALTESLKGNGTTMLLLSDEYLERDAKGGYTPALQAFYTMECLDHPDHRSIDEIAADAARLKKLYPPFGDLLGWGQVACAQWPIPGPVPAQRLTAPGARPILVVGTTQDPATPYEWAKALASQLSSGRLLTRQGQGHTGYKSGSACTDRAIEAFLVSGTLPAVGATCS